MPSAYEQQKEPLKKSKSIKSAFESESYDADWTIHVEGLVGSATISPSGRDVALASPEGLAIIDLDSPYSPPRRLSSRGLPWLVVDVQWSPFAARDYWVASTANHRCLVWNLNFRDDSASGPIEHSLQGHSRAITDINFSANHPDLLATCAVDGYVHNWDLRRPRQPALSFCDWSAGATQVKYSRQDSHILASSHDRLLHIWDDRRPTEPVKTIMAHSSKIYGLDWNRTRSSALVTCSLDKSIKFWDYSRDGEELERVIRTGFPVWRARHTPFGWGVLAMPQNEPGHLHLYDGRCGGDVPHDGRAEPVAVFDGHGEHKAKEFLWRGRGGVDDAGLDSRDFQLVSWGEDKELRLQRVESDVLAAVGYVKGQPAPSGLIITRKGATYKTFRTVDDGVHSERRNATMTDPRPSTSNLVRRSALSTGIQTPYYKTMTTWRPPSMKAKTTSKDADRGLAQIGWIRGVTMNKRKAPFEPPKREGPSAQEDSMFESEYHDSEWAEPETIQDEFVRISGQLPNVKWEHIDMDSLVIKASLKGPWGVDGESIFIKVNVDIPSAYPKTKPPKFIIEKSSFMPEATHAKLEREVQELASQLVECRKNCLDAAFSYLLGEVDLETSTTMFRNVRDLDDDIGGIADESSSDDDDDGEIPPGGSASMSQELPEVAAGGGEVPTVLGGGFRQTVIPVKRTCGARFSNDGKLACFFPSREEKAKLLFISTESAKEKTKGEPRFAGFGRLAHDSPPPRTRHRDDEASVTEDASGGSGDSDASSSSSSTDSELESANRISFWYRPGRKFRKTWSANDGSVRSSGGGTGTGTGTGTGAGTGRRRGAARSKNIVSVRDMRSLIPSKREFAQEYAIFGNGTEVCEHNARVAEKYGYHELVDIWRYSALLLRSDIPLRLAEQAPRRKSVLVIARDAVSRFHHSPATEDNGFLGTVKWGCHPLAQDFISDLFDYFERLADIQMLAMLSCIFGASSTEDGVAYAESHLTQPQTPLPMKAPSFSLEYFPTNPELWQSWHKSKSQESSAITTPRTSQTPNVYSSSVNSEEAGVWTGDPESNSYSCGEPSPLHLRSGREHSAETDQTQSLSTSPSSRAFRRANSAVTSALAASLPRTLQGMMSSSPPEPPPAMRKRPSPAEAIFGGFGPAVTWGASAVFGASSTDVTAPPSTRAPSIVEERRGKDETVVTTPVAVDVSVKLWNERQFDDDGWMVTPFLEPDRSALYASYRYAYAEMLQIWGQPLARLEIMKFNVLNGDGAGMADSGIFGLESTTPDGGASFHESIHMTHKGATGSTGTSSPTLLVGKREYLETVLTSGRGLDVTGICRIHETNLEPLQSTGRPLPRHCGSTLGATVTYPSSSATPVGQNGGTASASSGTIRDGGGLASATTIGGAVGTCDRCHSLQTQLRCVFCSEPVAALYPACLGCGCPSHESCLAEWHAAGERMCPAGDECDCAAEASRGTIESWTAIQSALAAARAVSASYHHQQHLTTGDSGGRTARRSTGSGGTSGGRVVRINTGAVDPRAKNYAPPVASPNVARPRRRSTPGHIPLGGSGSGSSWTGTEDENAAMIDVGSGGGGGAAKKLGAAAAAAAAPLIRGNDIDREDWENIASGAHLPSASSAGPAYGPHLPQAPLSAGPVGSGHMSIDGVGGGPSSGGAGESASSRLLGHPSMAAAHLSRLRKQVGDMGRPSILRQRSGGILPKKGP